MATIAVRARMTETPWSPSEALTKMVRQHRYAPVGRCIYCPEPASSDEHIVARSLGGMLVLPDASCASCADVTSQFERHCAQGTYASIRRQFGFPTYHKKRPQKARTLEVDGAEFVVPDSEFPGLIVGFNFPAPGILGLGPPAPAVFGGGVAVQTLPDFGDRLNRVDRDKRGTKFVTDLEARQFGRMLAKIGHGYAVAEFGIDGFRPLLLDIIQQPDPQYIGHLVGGAFSDPGPGNDLHEIRIDDQLTPHLIVVHVRLFADRGMPSYWVVAGQR